MNFFVEDVLVNLMVESDGELVGVLVLVVDRSFHDQTFVSRQFEVLGLVLLPELIGIGRFVVAEKDFVVGLNDY